MMSGKPPLQTFGEDFLLDRVHVAPVEAFVHLFDEMDVLVGIRLGGAVLSH
jgi:hypothetical protein